MNKIAFGEDLARQSRMAKERVVPGRIYPDGSIQGIRAELRYSSGQVAIAIADLPFAEKHGWHRSSIPVLAGCVMVERAAKPTERPSGD